MSHAHPIQRPPSLCLLKTVGRSKPGRSFSVIPPCGHYMNSPWSMSPHIPSSMLPRLNQRFCEVTIKGVCWIAVCWAVGGQFLSWWCWQFAGLKRNLLCSPKIPFGFGVFSSWGSWTIWGTYRWLQQRQRIRDRHFCTLRQCYYWTELRLCWLGQNIAIYT